MIYNDKSHLSPEKANTSSVSKKAPPRWVAEAVAAEKSPPTLFKQLMTSWFWGISPTR